MDMQNVSNLVIPEGEVRTIHDKDSRLIWGRLNYDTKYTGDTYQQTYSGWQMLGGDGMATPFSDTTYWSTTSGFTQTPLQNGWARLSNTSGSSMQFANCFIKTQVQFQASSTYTVVIELTNVEAGPRRLAFAAPASSSDSVDSYQFISCPDGVTEQTDGAVWHRSSGLVAGEYVLSFTTKNDLLTYLPRMYFMYPVDGKSFDMRMSIIQGNHSYDWQNYCGNNWQPFVGGGIPAPSPDFPEPIQVVTGEQMVAVSGKNLFDKNNVNQFMGYYDGTADNPILVSGAASRNRVIYIKCKPSTTYSISLTTRDGVNSPQVGTTNSLPVTGLAVTKLGTFASGSLKLENLTTSATAQYIVIRFQTNPSTVRFDDISQALLAGLQIEQGSTATDYEVFGAQTHVIDLRGKNLLNIADFAMGGLYRGEPSPSTYRINNANHAIAVQPNTTYTLSAQLVSPVQGFRVGIHEIAKDGTFLRDLGWEQLGTSPVTLTTDSDTYYLKMVGSLSTTSTNVTTGGTEDTTACTTVAEFMRGCTLQLEKGTTATAYTPFTQTELCKIGDYQDYIYKGDDGWYLHKEVRHLSLPVSGMNNSESYPGWVGVTELMQDFPAGTNVNMNTLTDSWDNITGVNLKDSGRLIWGVNNRANGVMYASRSFFGGAWNQTYWTTNYPNLIIELYYGIINAPTETKITDVTLITQLDAVHEWLTRYGYNATVTGNLPLIIDKTNL